MAAVRLAALVIAAAVVAVGAEGALPPLDFRFEATTARPGDRITVRTVQRGSSAPRLVRLYLVRADVARRIRSRLDSRLHFIGSLSLRRAAPSSLTFTVPPLESAGYAVAYSQGRTFSARSRNRLVVVAPPATADACPVTIPNGDVPRGAVPQGWTLHGNRLLAAAVPPTGAYIDQDGDGTVFEKMIWIAGGVSGALDVRYQRLDAPGPALAAEEIRGTLTGFAGPSWASRMYFGHGCWKVTGRVQDVSLSFVLKVAGPGPGA